MNDDLLENSIPGNDPAAEMRAMLIRVRDDPAFKGLADDLRRAILEFLR